MLYAVTPASEKRRVLRERLASGDILQFPGAFNPLSARLIERKGFDGVYISGAVLSADLGLPDIGLTTLTEVAGRGQQIARMTELPAIIDADTGFGEPMNVARTIQTLEDAGLAGTHIEDQVNPKRCGHLDGKSVVPVGEMAGKIDAALDARASAGTLILARTDAVAVEGLDAALDRAEVYLEHGADALFIEAVRSPEQMDIVCGRFAARVPLLVNLVEGGKTPMQPVAALQARGYRIAIFPGGTARAVAHCLQRYFGSLQANGSTLPFRDAMLDFDGLNAVIGTPELMALGKRYEDR